MSHIKHHQDISNYESLTLAIIICVDEPAGNAFGTIAADFTSVGVKYIHAVDGDLCVVVCGQCGWKISRSQILDRSDRLRPLSIRPTSVACACAGTICSCVTMPSISARIRNVSVSAREPLAIPRN